MIIGAHELTKYMRQAQDLYYNLVLLVKPNRVKRSETVYVGAKHFDCAVANLNLELSRQLINLTNRQRKKDVAVLFEECLDTYSVRHQKLGEIVFIDNIEILFEPILEIHVLNLIQKASRSRTLVSTWPGRVAENTLFYSVPEREDFQSHPVRGFFAFSAD